MLNESIFVLRTPGLRRDKKDEDIRTRMKRIQRITNFHPGFCRDQFGFRNKTSKHFQAKGFKSRKVEK